MWSLNQDLQQVIELKIEDTTCQRFDEEVKEKKVELIVDNDINQEMQLLRILWKIQLRLNMRMSPSPTIPRFRLIC